MVTDLLKKDIKIDRKIVILFVIFNFLIMGLYYTYSIFVIRQLKEDVSLIAVNTNVLSMQSSNLTDNKITVSAGSSQAIDITVTNPATIKMYYRIMHEGVPTGVSIYETNSDNTSYGEIATSGSITSSITINNTTDADVTVTFLLQESYDELFDKTIGTSYVNINESFDHSGATPPSFPSNMIPVYYVPASSPTTEGTWVKADVNNANANHIWYDYDNYRWANAVTVAAGLTVYSQVITENQTVSISNSPIKYLFESGNFNVNNSTSEMTLTFKAPSTAATFSFDYAVSSEAGYDKLTVTVNGTTIASAINGVKSGTYSTELTPDATYTINAKYVKDSSQHKNDDKATLSNFVLPDGVELELNSTGTYPWENKAGNKIASSYTYDSSSGTFVLNEPTNIIISSDIIGMYICSDINLSECATMYKINAADTTVTRVDVYKGEAMNARTAYQNASPGTTINNADINAFFVWIPEYKYYVVSGDGNTSYERLINVNFLNRNDVSKEGTVTCVESISTKENPHLYSEICTDSTYGTVQNNLSTYAHPAFSGGEDGFWIGKFSNRNYSGYLIKNNQSTSYNRSISVSYERQMINYDNVYGFAQNSSPGYDSTTWLYTNGVTNLDSHPITSMEWGAVAILTSSSYGKTGNPMYYTDINHGFTRVYNNPSSLSSGKSSNYTTSSNSVNVTSTITKNYYDLTDVTHTVNGITYPVGYVGAGASTTGTIYGVYDMAGGNNTRVMGIVMNEDGTAPYSMDRSFYTAYSYIPYTGKITESSKAAYLEVFRLGDGIKEHVIRYSGNVMWQNGNITFANYGYMRRGGYTTSGSLFTTEISYTTSNVSDDTFTVLKYYPE